jgi:hypothetical protein
MFHAAKALAMTAIDIYCSEKLLSQIRENFMQQKETDCI